MAWATTVMVTGCSSSEATPKGTDAGKKLSSTSSSGGDDDDSKSSSSGNSSSGSTTSSSSSGGTKDAGTDASTSSGGLAATKLKIACGATSCTADADDNGRCCWDNADVTKAACTNAQGECPAPDTSYEFACDDQADCATATDKCCFGNGHSTCSADCADLAQGSTDGLSIQLCLTDTECGGTTKCTLKACDFGTADTDDKHTIKVHVCGAPANCKAP